MPRRGNPFQSLIRALHANAADGMVEESALVSDRRTGTTREVDILIRTSSSGYPINIAVECTDTSSPADVTWVEQMVTKHADLPTDKLVLVSANGFTKSAVGKAESYDVVPLRLESLTDHPWAQVVGDRKELVLRALLARTLLVSHSHDVEPPSGEILFRADRLVRPQIEMTAGVLLDALLSNRSIREATIRVASETTGEGAEVFLPIHPGITLVRLDGSTEPVERLTMVYLQWRVDERVPVRTGRLRGVPVAFGGTRRRGRDLDLTIIEMRTVLSARL